MKISKLIPPSGEDTDHRSFITFQEITKEKVLFLQRLALKFLLKRGWACHKETTPNRHTPFFSGVKTHYYFEKSRPKSMEEKSI